MWLKNRRNISLLLFLTAAVLAGAAWFQASASFGGEHTDGDRQRYALSPQYDPSQDRFVNHNQDAIDAMADSVFNLRTISRQLSVGEDLVPDEKLPELAVDLEAFLDEANGPNIVWLGHSSFLIRIDGKTLLVDPVFENAGPVSFLAQRFQESIIARKDLPPIDYVLISHDHYDHLEAETVRYLAEQETRFIVPIGVGAHLKDWGIAESRFMEMDWWDEARIDDLLIAATPAQHYSGRRGFLANDTLWVSFVLGSGETALYLSGDSGYGSHFAEIAKRYGPFDLAFLENGQFAEISRNIHMYPEDAVKAAKDLGAEIAVPMHWGMFQLSRHAWYEPPARITELADEQGVAIYAPKIGEIMNDAIGYELDRWWVPLMKRQQASR